jgi:alpha-galactosidase
MPSKHPIPARVTCTAVRLAKATCTAIALALWLGSGIPAVTGAERQNATNSWKLATDDTEIVLSVKGGWPVLEALRSVATRRNWLSSPIPIKDWLMKSVKLDGVSKDLDWKFEGADLDPKGEQLSLRFSNSSPKLSLDSVWRARSGHGPVEHWLTMTNESGHTITVPQQESLVLTNLVVPSKESAQAWWINRGGSNASTEGGTFTVGVDPDFDQVLLSDPTDGSSPVPWMTVQVGQHEGLYVGWEFSGIGGIHARTTSTDPRRFELRVGLAPDFRTDIPASETFLAPPAFVGCYEGDVDDGSYTLHRFILEKLLPPLPQDQPYPGVICNQYLDFGGYNKAREADVMSHATFCKQLGFETFVPDCLVWFPKMGDWRWDPARFPRGGGPIEEYTHQSGMKLGFWMAWTHMGDSIDPGALNVFRHPDWSTEKLTPEWKMDADSWGTTMDLGFDPARDWAEHEVERVIGENHLDYLKHDYSPIVTTCVQTNHRHHYGVDVSYWSTLGYYHVMEGLKQRYPNLILEGCSGGGHIKDFGYIKRVHYIVTDDTLSALPDRQSIYDSTFAFPPAVLLAYTYENMYNKDADQPRPYLWRSATMSGWVIAPVHSASWSPDEIASAQRATEIFKSWIRPILKDVKVHHILPRPDGFHWDGMFYWSPSLKRGTLYIFRPNNDQATQRIRLKGLTPEAQYRLRSEEGSVPEETRAGDDLMSSGLKVKLTTKYSSDLIYLEQSK